MSRGRAGCPPTLRGATQGATPGLRDAGEGTRTPKGFRPLAPKASVSTNSTTPARGVA